MQLTCLLLGLNEDMEGKGTFSVTGKLWTSNLPCTWALAHGHGQGGEYGGIPIRHPPFLI